MEENLDECNKARRGVYKDAPNYFLGWYRIGIAAKFRKKVIEKEEKKKKASPLVQDIYPDTDRIRGTILYPLSCGELAVHGKKI